MFCVVGQRITTCLNRVLMISNLFLLSFSEISEITHTQVMITNSLAELVRLLSNLILCRIAFLHLLSNSINLRLQLINYFHNVCFLCEGINLVLDIRKVFLLCELVYFFLKPLTVTVDLLQSINTAIDFRTYLRYELQIGIKLL